MHNPTVKVDFDKYTVKHYVDLSSGNEERMVMAAHDLIEGGILHLHASQLRPVLKEFFTQVKAWNESQASAQSNNDDGYWNNQLKGIKGIDEE